MIQHSTAPKPKQFTGWHMLAIMVVFFGGIIIVNIFLAMLATNSWTGLIVKNTYVASQEFNDHLASAHAQKERGWTSELSYTAGRLSASFLGIDKTPLFPDAISARIGRPTYEQQDQFISLNYVKDGIYASDIQLAPGLWQITLQADIKNIPYKREARLFVKSDGTGRIQ
jgi:nitrogen fixation protein FixH